MNIYTETEYDIIHEINVDFILRPVPREIHIVQYDKTLPIVKVNLFNNGQKYLLPNDATVNVRFGWPGKIEVNKPILGWNEDRNIVYFAVDENMTNIKGKFGADLEIVLSNNHGCSSPILITIDGNPVKKQQL